MYCNLVKTLVVFKDADGNEKKFLNYALKFENGEVIPITLKVYSTNSNKKEDIEKFARINAQNSVKLNCFADMVEK